MRKTKIVATLGPVTSNQAMIESLIQKGVNVFRLNFSHGDYPTHEATYTMIRTAATKLDKPIAILQDISGPKIRIGDLAEPMKLERNDTMHLTASPNTGANRKVSLNTPSIIKDLRVGDEVFFADGVIRTEVIEASAEEVKLKVLVGGVLTSKKGVNFPSAKLNIGAITPKDRNDLVFGAKIGVDIVAISFVQTPEDILEVKSILHEHKSKAMVYAKIEMKQAVANLDAILEVSDGAMVARGDLGVELGLQKVPLIQKRLIAKANALGKPVITATQMLTSMLHSPFPTRAEVSDIANAVLDGTDAVMLSDETAVGQFPQEAIEVLVSTIMETESIYRYYRHNELSHGGYDALPSSVSMLAQSTSPEAILVFSASGTTARSIAKFRPMQPIYVNTTTLTTYNQLAIVWGVEPLLVMNTHHKADKLIEEFIESAELKGALDPTKTYLLTMGFPQGKHGTTNSLRILDPITIEHIKKHKHL